MLVAMLMLLSLALGPVLPALAAADPIAALEGGFVICHAGPAGDQVPLQSPGKPQGKMQDCQLCPACHLAAETLLPIGGAAIVSEPGFTLASIPAATPPATGPPHPARRATPPTGPPAIPA